MKKKAAEVNGGNSPINNPLWEQITNLINDEEIPVQDVLESFAIYTRRINITRFLAHYELYKMIADVPGCVVECGVYQGNSLFTFAKFLEIFHPGDRIRNVIGFDSFQGLQDFAKQDGPLYPKRSKVKGGWSAATFRDCFYKLLDIYHADSFVPHSKRIEMVEGDLNKTVPEYVKKHPGLRISLLHLDVDLYKPTLTALKYLYPLVVKGGLIVLDEYGMTEWGGESQAFEEYFGKDMPKVQKFNWVSTPGAYFIK